MTAKPILLCLTILLAAAAAAPAQSLLVPATRGEAGTIYSAWDIFSSTTHAAPDVAGTVGSLSELSGSSFLTGGGNIYQAGAPAVFTLDVSLGFEAGAVLFQTITLGTELDYDGVALTYEDAFLGTTSLSSLSTTELGRVPLGGFGGESVGTAFSWDLTGLGVSDFTLEFAATGPHLSLDQVALDVAGAGGLAVIPEPASLGLWAGFAGLLLLLGRRRR